MILHCVQKYKNRKDLFKVKNKNVNFKDRLIHSSCYLTYGFTGLLLLIDNIFLSNLLFEYPVNRSIVFHTFQALVLTILMYASIFILELLKGLHVLLLSNYSYNQIIFMDLSMIIVYLATTLFLTLAFISVMGYNYYLPGIKPLAIRFFIAK